MRSRSIVKAPSATTIPGHYILVATANHVAKCEIFWHKSVNNEKWAQTTIQSNQGLECTQVIVKMLPGLTAHKIQYIK